MGQLIDPEHFPNLSSAAPEALDDEDEDFYAEEFDRGLRLFLDGIDAMIARSMTAPLLVVGSWLLPASSSAPAGRRRPVVRVVRARPGVGSANDARSRCEIRPSPRRMIRSGSPV